MENEQSSFNVIHWESNLSRLKKSAPFDVQIGVSGGWLNEIAVLIFKWRIICTAENITALHFVVENNFVIQDLTSFNESKMKTLLLQSHEKVNRELGMRTNETGNIFVDSNFQDTIISMYYNEFLQALAVR